MSTYRRDDFKALLDGEIEANHKWPQLLKQFHGSRGGGKTEDLEQERRVRNLLHDNRRLFWEARRDSVIVNRAFQCALENGLEESDAVLLSVVALLDENRRLMRSAQVLLGNQPPDPLRYIGIDTGGGKDVTVAHDGSTEEVIQRWQPTTAYVKGDKVLGYDGLIHVCTAGHHSLPCEPCWPSPFGWETNPNEGNLVGQNSERGG